MKKFLFIFGLSIFFLSSPVHAIDFQDLDNSSEYFREIEYLANNDIIHGVEKSHGTYFEADRPVTRCEYLKMLFNIYDIDLPETLTDLPFSDISKDHWCYPFVWYGYTNSFIQGQDGNFFPERTVNKVEALKLALHLFKLEIGEKTDTSFSDVSKENWFSPYVALSEHFNVTKHKNFFSPADPITRKDAVRILYRLISVAAVNQPYTEEIFLNNAVLSQLRSGKSTSMEEAYIPEDGFDQITLDSPIKNIFINNEMIPISGRVEGSNVKEVTIFLHNEITNTQKVSTVPVRANRFISNIIFSEPGQFSLGILPGKEGLSTTYMVAVVKENISFPETTNISLSCQLSLIHTDDGGTQVNLSPSYDTYYFRVSHGSLQKTFLIHDVNTFTFPYTEFVDWDEGEYVIKVIGINTASCTSEKVVTSVTHNFSTIEDELSINNLSHFISRGQNIIISGRSSEPLRPTYEVINPRGIIESFNLTNVNKTLSPNTPFTISYKPSMDGVYLFEINHENGIAQLNYPVYVGDIYPLLPDFRDILFAYRSMHSNSVDVLQARNILLELLNDTRKQQGKEPVVLDETLSKLAQAHTEDMAQRKFFGHDNPDGKGIQERAADVGITNPVGENLSKNFSLKTAYEGLLRSAIHRANLLDNKWDIVGLGVAQDSDGLFYIAQEFSYTPWEANDETQVDSLSYHTINNIRKEYNLPALQLLNNLHSDMVRWSQNMAEKDIVSSEIQGTHVLDTFTTDRTVTEGIVLNSKNAITLQSQLEKFTDIIKKIDIASMAIGSYINSDGKAYASIVFFK